MLRTLPSSQASFPCSSRQTPPASLLQLGSLATLPLMEAALLSVPLPSVPSGTLAAGGGEGAAMGDSRKPVQDMSWCFMADETRWPHSSDCAALGREVCAVHDPPPSTATTPSSQRACRPEARARGGRPRASSSQVLACSPERGLGFCSPAPAPPTWEAMRLGRQGTRGRTPADRCARWPLATHSVTLVSSCACKQLCY